MGIYVHLPFCARKCRYCDFNSRPAPQAERIEYLRALRTEISARAQEVGQGRTVATVFFGGGTPTIYDGEDLARLLGMIGETFHVRRGAEISIEANPESVDAPKLRRLRAAGFNRLSVGAQSFDDDELRMLGRGHAAADVVRAVQAAREAGFGNLSLDLIYALPGQAVSRWERTLEQALRLRPEHLSAYGLSLEPGTPLARRVAAGELEVVSEEDHLAMRHLGLQVCAAAGLRRYEISNYACPGRECQHNLIYWRNQEYLGLGAGAWSYLEGVRAENVREPGAYVRAVLGAGSPVGYRERLDVEARLLERVMLGLRLREGLALAELEGAFGQAQADELKRRAEELARAGVVERRDGRLRLTTAGEDVHSEVCERLT